MDFSKTKTFKNLMTAYAGECLDGANYQFMARMAKNQGLIDLQYNLKTLAKEEMGHAKRLHDIIVSNAPCNNGTKCEVGAVSGVQIEATYPIKGGTLEEMLDFAVKTEKHQKDVVYKNFAQQAKSDGYDEIYELFTYLGNVENCHSLLNQELCNMLKGKKLYQKPTKTTWKCSNCGHETTDKKAPQTCPLCKAEQGYVYVKSEKYRYFQP